jgi:hypothetical protein
MIVSYESKNIVNIWNVLDVNRLGDYICVCLQQSATTPVLYTGRRRRRRRREYQKINK